MGFNVHPVFVHFPIAFLTLYAIVELLPFTYIRKSHTIRAVKLSFLFIGEIGTVVAGLTGKLASQDAAHNPSVKYPRVIETHSTFAELTFILFGIITLLYLAQLITQYYKNILILPILGLASEKYYLIAPLALVSLTMVTITGALGGIIVYGPTMDPITQFVYQLLIH